MVISTVKSANIHAWNGDSNVANKDVMFTPPYLEAVSFLQSLLLAIELWPSMRESHSNMMDKIRE